ncbi:complement component (3d Epstein Barr virus) receptor 2 [Chamberlinius hualienensis]
MLLNWFLIALIFSESYAEDGCLHPGKSSYIVAAMSDSHTNGLFPVGTIISYTCDSGYEILNNQTRICLQKGTWSGEEPYCGSDITERAIASNYWSSTTGLWPKYFHNCLESISGTNLFFKFNQDYEVHYIELIFSSKLNLAEVEHGERPVLYLKKKINWGMPMLKKWTKIGDERFVYQFKVLMPVSENVTAVSINFPDKNFTFCGIRLYTNTILSYSLCKFESEINVKQFLYGDKCYAVFDRNIRYDWKTSKVQCENYNTQLNSSAVNKISLEFINCFYFIIRSSFFYQDYFWINNPSNSSSCSYIYMRKNVVYRSLNCYGFSGQICEYDFPKCGTPDQKFASEIYYIDDQMAKYTCAQSYSVNGTSVRRCSNGKWTPEAPICLHNENFFNDCWTPNSKAFSVSVNQTIVAIFIIIQWTLNGISFIFFN